MNSHQGTHSATHQGSEHKKKYFGFDYDKHYKVLFILPALLLIGSLIYLAVFYSSTGDIMYKDVTLTGGTTLTIFDGNVSIKSLESALGSEFDDLSIRALTDFSSGKTIAISIETRADQAKLKSAVEKFLGYSLNSDNSSIEFSGSSLSDSFYKQLIIAMLLAFSFMMVTVFIIFRSPLPSAYVTLSAFMDIVATIAVVDIIGLKVSTAGIAAFLMLIGYSVETDILLTARALKSADHSFNKRVFGAFKTGTTIMVSSILAFTVAYFAVISPVLQQVFLILVIGLSIDLISTWCMNASLLKWSEQKKHQH